MRLSPDKLEFDCEAVTNRIGSVIKTIVKNANVDGIVIGVSGGIDSSVTLTLCKRALDKKTIYSLMMPDVEVTPKEDVEDAFHLTERLDIDCELVNIREIYSSFMKSTTTKNVDKLNRQKLAKGNVRARIRMTLLYYYANIHNLLVIGTGDRSEILIGYFTKWGDGGADMLPLGGLYKTQVRHIAKHLDVPERIIVKQSSPRLWKDQMTAEEEIGMKYGLLDLILYGLIDCRMKMEEVSNELKVSNILVRRVREMTEKSKHKRVMPPMPFDRVVSSLCPKNNGINTDHNS
jgi:NAD+ synthase